MLKFIKFIAGLLLLPLAYAVTITGLKQLETDASFQTLSTTTRWFLGGFGIWLLLFLIFPRPIRTYVLGHELTHALWGVLMGARVSRLKVNKKGGSVRLTKTNVWITLAPYFFPFYSVLALLAFLATHYFWDMTYYLPFWYGLFGLTWAFHITFTIDMLGTQQPDIQEHGRLFSYVLIYVINIATAALLLNLLTGQPLHELPAAFWQETRSTYLDCARHAEPWLGAWKAKW